MYAGKGCCSIIVPSRGNKSGLFALIRSLHDNAQADRFEILVRLDEDDSSLSEYVKVYNWWRQRVRTTLIIGPRDGGYIELHSRYDELSYLARNQWVWFLDDDVVVEGDWLSPLEEMHETIVYGEFYELGASRYERPGLYFPILPNQCWKKYKAELCQPVDQYLYTLLVELHGWVPNFLSGVVVHHDGRPRVHRNELER